MNTSSSSRAPPPPPLDMTMARAYSGPFASGASASSNKVSRPARHGLWAPRLTREQTERSYSSDSASRPGYASHNRSNSDASGSSASSMYGPRKSSASPKVNVYTTCGRHSNQWLFSGWGFGKKH